MMTERLSVEQIEHDGLIRRIRERAINQRLCNVADADNWDEAADALTALRAEVERLQGIALEHADYSFKRENQLIDKAETQFNRATAAEAALAARPDDGLVERLRREARLWRAGCYADDTDQKTAAEYTVRVLLLEEAAAALKGRQA